MHTCFHMCLHCIHYMYEWHKYIHTRVHTYMHTCIHTHIHTYMHACMHTCTHAFIDTCMHCIHYMYVHTYTHIYIHMEEICCFFKGNTESKLAVTCRGVHANRSRYPKARCSIHCQARATPDLAQNACVRRKTHGRDTLFFHKLQRKQNGCNVSMSTDEQVRVFKTKVQHALPSPCDARSCADTCVRRKTQGGDTLILRLAMLIPIWYANQKNNGTCSILMYTRALFLPIPLTHDICVNNSWKDNTPCSQETSWQPGLPQAVEMSNRFQKLKEYV